MKDVIVTRDRCYDNPEDGRPFRERDAVGGRDPSLAGDDHRAPGAS